MSKEIRALDFMTGINALETYEDQKAYADEYARQHNERRVAEGLEPQELTVDFGALGFAWDKKDGDFNPVGIDYKTDGSGK